MLRLIYVWLWNSFVKFILCLLEITFSCKIKINNDFPIFSSVYLFFVMSSLLLCYYSFTCLTHWTNKIDDADDTTWSQEREVVLERVQNKSFGISIVGGKVSSWCCDKREFLCVFVNMEWNKWTVTRCKSPSTC